MGFKNFLGKLYFDRLDMETFSNYPDHELKGHVPTLIHQYDEIGNQFSRYKTDGSDLVPRDLLDELKTIGFFGLNIPGNYGGLGLSLSEYLKVVENVASRSMDLGITALAHLSIGTKGILLFGSEAQKQKYLSQAASGEMIFSYALTDSHCKLFGTTRAWNTVNEALQVAGGAGYLSTQPYEKRLRDFRIATIFEGTTEIHSIYPALYLLKDLSKKFDPRTATFIERSAFILKALFSPVKLGLRFKYHRMRQAAGVVKKLARRIRIRYSPARQRCGGIRDHRQSGQTI